MKSLGVPCDLSLYRPSSHENTSVSRVFRNDWFPTIVPTNLSAPSGAAVGSAPSYLAIEPLSCSLCRHSSASGTSS
jgi:hypothetical protein